MQAIMETIFDVLYFAVALYLGIVLLKDARGRVQYILFGAMALILVFGDAFHLVPRIIALNTTGLDAYSAQLGVGKLITSITSTVFYVVLYYAWRARYRVKERLALTVWVWALAAVRIILCMFPQNAWLSAQSPLSWDIYRNLPFVPLGVILMVLFYRWAQNDRPLRFAWLAIAISFACYLPVVLFVRINPLLGALMIPKTLAYVWLMAMTRAAQKAEG